MAIKGVDHISQRDPADLGSVKSNAEPVVDEATELPAEQYNALADAVIELQELIGTDVTPDADTIVEVLRRALVSPLSADVDADGHRITNLAAPVDPDDAARLQDVPGALLPQDDVALTTYTVLPTDAARVVAFTSGSAITVLFPADADEDIAVGAWGLIYAAGAGQITFSADVGATLRAPNGATKSAAQYTHVMWRKVAADTFAISGSLVP